MTAEQETQLDDHKCGCPCDPRDGCDECAEYWERMRDEGFWIDGKGWTNKAVWEWTKIC